VRFASAASTQAHLQNANAAFRADATFKTAVFASVVAYAVMSFIMTAAPMNMHVMDHHSMEVATWVIQSHVLAMFLPSLVSGRVIDRFGERAVMLWGGVLMAACVAVNMSGRQVMHYWWGLVLLGVGWNLLFVAGTTLLTRSCQGPGRYRAQAINDFTVFGSQACASLLAGLAVHQLGWTLLNVATIPLIAAMMIGASRLRFIAAAGATSEPAQRAS
jgi:MFS family permease